MCTVGACPAPGGGRWPRPRKRWHRSRRCPLLLQGCSTSIKADGTWYDVLSGDTPAVDLLETHWVDFSTGTRYHGSNQDEHQYPTTIPDIHFWKLARIQGFRFQLVNDTEVTLPLFRVYNTLLRQGNQRVPLLSKPIRIQYSEI